jgi:hypothetical protein
MASTAEDSAEESSAVPGPASVEGSKAPQLHDGSPESLQAQRSRPGRRQQLEQRIRDHAVEIDLYLELAALHRAEDRPLEAKRVLQQAMQIDKDDLRVVWQYEEAVLARSLQQLREVSDLASRLNTPEMRRELERSENDWANRRLEVCRARLAREPEKHHFRLVMAEAMMDLGMHEEVGEYLLPCFDSDEHAPAARLIQGKCLMAMDDDLGALAAFRAAGLRRSIQAPAKIRIAAMRAASEIAQRLGLTLSLQRYAHALEIAEQELAET